VVDFEHPHGCIVNAANEGCLGGGGVDGAITEAGGPDLARDRLLLPSSIPLDDNYYEMIRCPTGDARRTGPGRPYGALKVPHVIHAVGPRYFDFENEDTNKNDEVIKQADQLLQSAYLNTLERAKEVHLEAVAFSLLSAGVYRGSQTRYHVLRIGMETILQFQGYKALQEVHMCAFSPVECNTLMNIAQDLGLRTNNE